MMTTTTISDGSRRRRFAQSVWRVAVVATLAFGVFSCTKTTARDFGITLCAERACCHWRYRLVRPGQTEERVTFFLGEPKYRGYVDALNAPELAEIAEELAAAGPSAITYPVEALEWWLQGPSSRYARHRYAAQANIVYFGPDARVLLKRCFDHWPG